MRTLDSSIFNHRRVRAACALLCMLAGIAAAQGPPADYAARLADRYRAAFALDDRDKDGKLTRADAMGDVLMETWFNDIDANRDGVITAEELERFLAAMPPSAR